MRRSSPSPSAGRRSSMHSTVRSHSEQVQDAERQAALAAFDLLDADGSGELSAGELRTCLEATGHENTDTEVRHIMHDMDPNGDGVVTKREYMRWWTSAGTSKGAERRMPKAQIQSLLDMFQKLDVEGDGLITIAQCAQALVALGDEKTVAEAERGIRAGSVATNGLITSPEFVAWSSKLGQLRLKIPQAGGVAMALRDSDAADQSDLYFEEGQIIECSYVGRSGWWSGSVREADGSERAGLFPPDAVEVMADRHPAKLAYLRRGRRNRPPPGEDDEIAEPLGSQLRPARVDRTRTPSLRFQAQTDGRARTAARRQTVEEPSGLMAGHLPPASLHVPDNAVLVPAYRRWDVGGLQQLSHDTAHKLVMEIWPTLNRGDAVEAAYKAAGLTAADRLPSGPAGFCRLLKIIRYFHGNWTEILNADMGTGGRLGLDEFRNAVRALSGPAGLCSRSGRGLDSGAAERIFQLLPKSDRSGEVSVEQFRSWLARQHLQEVNTSCASAPSPSPSTDMPSSFVLGARIMCDCPMHSFCRTEECSPGRWPRCGGEDDCWDDSKCGCLKSTYPAYALFVSVQF